MLPWTPNSASDDAAGVSRAVAWSSLLLVAILPGCGAADDDASAYWSSFYALPPFDT